MGKFILKRVLQAIPTMLGITFIAFLITYLAPGDVSSQLTLDPELNQRQREAMKEAMGVNDPFHVQYARWMVGDAPLKILGVELWGGRELPVFDRRGMESGTTVGTNKGVLRGDLGRSIVFKRSVIDLLQNRIQPTLEIGLMSLLLGVGIGIPIGVLAAVWQGGIFDQSTRILSVLVSSIPVFWLGLILLLVFGSYLEWLPMGNRRPISVSGEYSNFEIAKHYVLPVFTLSSFTIATFSRFMRASVLDVLSQDYIRTARAKGLSDGSVWFIHATRNALIPIATIIGPALTGVIGGAVLTETIYAWPGMGTFTVQAITAQDHPVIMAVVLILSLATIIGYLISDVLYAVLDPRIHMG